MLRFSVFSDGDKKIYVSFAPVERIGWSIIVEEGEEQTIKIEVFLSCSDRSHFVSDVRYCCPIFCLSEGEREAD